MSRRLLDAVSAVPAVEAASTAQDGPEPARGLADFARGAALLRRVEASAQASGIAPVDASALSELAGELHDRGASLFRTRLLSRVRQLALDTAAPGCSASTAVRNATEVFRRLPWPATQVRTSAVQVAQLSHAALEAATARGASPAAARLLVGAVRDALDVWRALAPEANGGGVGSVPGLAMLCSNDMDFLAINCLVLTARYRPLLPTPVRKDMSLSDTAAALCCAAADLRTAQVNRQTHIVQSFLEDALAFFASVREGEAPAAPHGRSAAEVSVRQVLHHLHHLQSAWASMVSGESLAGFLGAIIATAAEDLIAALVGSEDADNSREPRAGVEACAVILSSFCRGVSELHLAAHVDVDGDDRSDGALVASDDHRRGLDRARAVVALIDEMLAPSTAAEAEPSLEHGPVAEWEARSLRALCAAGRRRPGPGGQG